MKIIITFITIVFLHQMDASQPPQADAAGVISMEDYWDWRNSEY